MANNSFLDFAPEIYKSVEASGSAGSTASLFDSNIPTQTDDSDLPSTPTGKKTLQSKKKRGARKSSVGTQEDENETSTQPTEKKSKPMDITLNKLHKISVCLNCRPKPQIRGFPCHF